MTGVGPIPYCVLRGADPTRVRFLEDEPTDAELAETFGEPERLGPNFMGLLDVDGTGARVWLCALVWSFGEGRLYWRRTPIVRCVDG